MDRNKQANTELAMPIRAVLMEVFGVKREQVITPDQAAKMANYMNSALYNTVTSGVESMDFDGKAYNPRRAAANALYFLNDVARKGDRFTFPRLRLSSKKEEIAS